MELLQKSFLNLLRNTDNSFQRTLNVNWDNRMIAIVGARGVGKTTYIMQHIKQRHKNLDEVLYASLDHLYFYERPLMDVVDEFVSYGGKYLYLDEVHKYDGWSRVLKNIYDHYPNLKVAFTSSSILDVFKGDADLSRRVVKYEMNGMSFREYLRLVRNITLSQLTLEQLLTEHTSYYINLPKDFLPLPVFKEYLQSGYYPFTIEPDFLTKLHNALMNVIELDLSQVENLTQNKVVQVKKVLGVIAESAPFKPNISQLAQKLQISRDIILSIIHLLEKAKILNLLQAPNKGVSLLQKPDKIYLENTNLMYALKDLPDIGNIRETFFMNQLQNAGHSVRSSESTDFLVDQEFSFEIGGRSKKQTQVKALKNAFVVKDGIESGMGNVVPLWMFGVLY
ncbi:AAA family ATPase [Limibacter armeniacum]|uniref:ATP-binding protein n=1 Tax=Limibacter armeniacum TaxID=466084 RepID=UPI002FE6B93F